MDGYVCTNILTWDSQQQKENALPPCNDFCGVPTFNVKQVNWIAHFTDHMHIPA